MKDSWHLYLLVFLGGAAVLAIEILGTRILGPFYGVSLFLWSALITVTLAALSAGYAVGGWWADKAASLRRLSLLMGASGIWVLLIPLLRSPILRLLEPLGLRAAVLVAALVLFTPPLFLLGMVSPMAIRIRASSLEVVGRTAGNLYAVSTMASVLSALLTGFFLIPNIGVARLTLTIGLVLVAVAVPGLLPAKRPLGAGASVLLLAGGLAVVSALRLDTPDPDRGILAIEQSAYGEIRVVEASGERYLLIDGGVHTIVEPETWQTHFPYANVVELSRDYFETPGDMLLIGLGGGSVAKSFSRAGWSVDAVEIDPVVTKMANEFFGLEESEAQVYCMDGRQFLLSHQKKYQIVVMDAFGSSAIPFHLSTKEAFALISSRLADGGVFVVNLEAIGWDHLLVRAFAATLRTQFDSVFALPTQEPPNTIGNVLVFASNRDLEDRDQPPVPVSRLSSQYDRTHAWDNRFEPEVRGAPVLTDDRNPVDLWAERINLVARRDLHEYFGGGGTSW